MSSVTALEEVDVVVHHLKYLLLLYGTHLACADEGDSSRFDPVDPEQVCEWVLVS
jgi:hypothetical protein